MPIRKELATIADLETGARVFSAGAYLYRQGDACSSCFILLSGWVGLSALLDDGSCQTLDFALPGAVLGFQSTPGAPMYHSARCLSAVRVYAFPRRAFESLVEANSRLAVLLCRQITADEARAHDHLINLGLRGARERIAHLLLELYVRLHHNVPCTPGEVTSLPLSQGQIGDALGLTYVHVCRMLHSLHEEKIVKLANRRLEIIDPKKFLAAADVWLDAVDEDAERTPPGVMSVPGVAAAGQLPTGWMCNPPLQSSSRSPRDADIVAATQAA